MGTMPPEPALDTDQEGLTLADIRADMGKNPDRTGDFAAGRTHFHATTEEFLACLDSQPYDPADS